MVESVSAAAVPVCVVHVAVVGIQKFVFGSRTLVDTVGRSGILEQRMGREFLTVAGRDHPEWGLGVEHAAAGRIAVLVAPESAKDFVTWYTRELADLSDTLQPVLVIDACDDEAAVAESLARAAESLHRARHATGGITGADGLAGGAWSAVPSLAGAAPWGALTCAVSGQAAEGTDQEGRAWSGEVARAQQWGKRWHREQQEWLLASAPEPLQGRLALPRLTDRLGRSHGKSSRVAVLVADLNGVGELLQALARGPDARARSARASAALHELSRQLGKHIVDTVISALVPDPVTGAPMLNGFPQPLRFALSRGEQVFGEDPAAWMLPVRPWVLAGDDLVLICESRVAWSLARAVFAWLDDPDVAAGDPRAELEELWGRRPTIGIGIAVVPVGFPLIGAHTIAQTLGKNAKRRAKRAALQARHPHHGIDWQVGGTDPTVALEARAHSAPPFVFAAGTTTFEEFLLDWLGEGECSLRGPDFAEHRGWVRGRLRAAALDSIADSSPAARAGGRGASSATDPVGEAVAGLNRSRAVAGKPAVSLPVVERRRRDHYTLAAIDLFDEHLALIPTEKTDGLWDRLPGVDEMSENGDVAEVAG